MIIMNKLVKVIGYIGIYLIAFLQSYALSLLCSPVVLCIELSVMSAIGKFPIFATEHFALLFILSAIPLAFVFFIFIITDYYLKFSMHSFKKETDEQKE